MIRGDLAARLEQFKQLHPVDPAVQSRVTRPQVEFIGEEILDLAVSALLQGENILLSGGKATGKNILADNLAWLFARPVYNVSFHVNTDSGTLIGTDTFVDGQVQLRHGPVAQAARYGGFCVLDEINMAKNEAVAVLHAALDYRRLIDVPGYDRIPMHPAARFIATMNYGYAGTRELNEALASRFVVIQMPAISPENLDRLLKHSCPELKQKYRQQFVSLFFDLQKKCEGGEISSKALDLRGLLDALELMAAGVPSGPALDMGITNKTADGYEQGLIRDVMAARVSPKLTRGELFGP